MRAILTLLLAAMPAFAADPKPNMLTPKEIADGWMLLFDGETTFGWDIVGEAAVKDGTLLLGGAKGAYARPTSAFGGAELSFEWQNLSESAFPRMILKSGKQQGVIVCDGDRKNRLIKVRVGFDATATRQTTQHSRRFDRASGPELREETITFRNSEPVRIQFEVPQQGRVALRNVTLRPLGLQPVFNGKDLSGWKEHPGRKSKFSVTKEGWLNVEDGNGDLQTEGQWGNFVLQLECISNGKHLNSGIFFRCRPNEYQQGYEAQIRNQFTEAPTQKYVVEEYDPKTHELKGKKEVMSPAVDYGTGAIYRRQPARRGVAKDGEWFTLTVVARGRHFATWVNGIQVTDWTDHRKLNDNARNGCRLEKGPISIQGHDPTTDLSFRRIRIVELP